MWRAFPRVDLSVVGNRFERDVRDALVDKGCSWAGRSNGEKLPTYLISRH
jgi:hypothetical protein